MGHKIEFLINSYTHNLLLYVYSSEFINAVRQICVYLLYAGDVIAIDRTVERTDV